MRWNRAVSSRFQAGTGHGSGFHGAGWSAIRKPAAAGSRGCSIGVFREGKMEIPDNQRRHSRIPPTGGAMRWSASACGLARSSPVVALGLWTLLLFPAALSGQALLTAADVVRLPSPPPDHRIAYGEDALQFGHLRLPSGPGPHQNPGAGYRLVNIAGLPTPPGLDACGANRCE